MDYELKCNRLTCRKNLTDKAVVTTCSHIFCVECANELFTAARSCPACESLLSEPDDVVICSLHPSNDYKTSVLSGLSPSVVLEICSRAIAFWQYQIHQENSFQQAVLKNVTEKNAQAQKQLENVVREANSEISLLAGKAADLERELEHEKRKVRDLAESGKEKDKEYQRLKAQHDKLKRKLLLAPGIPQSHSDGLALPPIAHGIEHSQHRAQPFAPPSSTVDLQAVAGSMQVQRIHRTPISNGRGSTATAPNAIPGSAGSGGDVGGNGHSNWNRPQRQPRPQQRHSFAIPPRPDQRSFLSNASAVDEDSANEVEDLLVPLSKSSIPRRPRPNIQNNKPIWVPQSKEFPFAPPAPPQFRHSNARS